MITFSSIASLAGFTPPSFTPPSFTKPDVAGFVTGEIQKKLDDIRIPNVPGLGGLNLSGIGGLVPPNIGGLIPNSIGGTGIPGLGLSLGGRTSRSKMYQRVDPLFSFDFSAELPGLDDIYVEDVTVPMDKIEAIANFRAGTNTYYAGNYDISGLNIKFYEDRRHKVLRYLWGWRKSIHDDKGNFNPSAAYKRKIIVKTLDSAGIPVGTFIFTGCFPTDIDPINLSSSSNDRVVMGASFSTDGLEIKFR